MRAGRVVLSILLAIAGVATGCSQEVRDPGAFSVVFITVDTLRSDRLGAYGYAEAKTPAIDKLASEGVLFENVYCDVPWTTASVASIMTGLYNTEHGLQAPWLRLPESRLTMAEVFRDHGYKTGAVVGIFSLDSEYGLDQGFDVYDDDFSLPAMVRDDGGATVHVELEITDDIMENARLASAKMENDAYKTDADVTDSALEWLDGNKDEQFFLWAHYFGPHEKVIFAEAARSGSIKEQILSDYDPDLTTADAAIGRLLKGLDERGLRGNTLVILSSDHGQMLGERVTVGHGRDLLEPDVRIPLILRLPSGVDYGPENSPGRRISQVVRSVDIFPTLLDYADIAKPDRLVGRSVRDLLKGTEETERLAFMDLTVIMPTPMADDDGEYFSGTLHLQALRKGKWKFVRGNLIAPCWGGGEGWQYGGLGLVLKGRQGAVRLPDEECSSHEFTSLFDVSQQGSSLAAEKKDWSSKHPALVKAMAETVRELASRKGQAESFELSKEQEDKLKSLGYLQ